jgi:hypothetical protein
MKLKWLMSLLVTACFLAMSNVVVAQESNASDTTIKGHAAWDSPQGKVLAEFLRAARAGDKAALRKVMATNQANTLDGSNAAPAQFRIDQGAGDGDA